jgi:hypothetical protein
MFSLMAAEAAALALVLLGVTVGLVLAVFRSFPRGLQKVPALVTCPLLWRKVTAEVMRDDWTLRFTDVTRCSVLGREVGLCHKACLAAGEVESGTESHVTRSG